MKRSRYLRIYKRESLPSTSQPQFIWFIEVVRIITIVCPIFNTSKFDRQTALFFVPFLEIPSNRDVYKKETLSFPCYPNSFSQYNNHWGRYKIVFIVYKQRFPRTYVGRLEGPHPCWRCALPWSHSTQDERRLLLIRSLEIWSSFGTGHVDYIVII